MLNTKDLVFKERLVKELVEHYVRSYMIEEIVLTNNGQVTVTTSMRIYLVVKC